MVDKAKTAKVLRQFTPKRTAIATTSGFSMELPNHSGYQGAQALTKTPTKDFQIANKKYVDDTVGVGTWTDSSTNT